MSGVVVATNPAEEPNDKALRHHGQLSESQDLLADLSVDEPLAKAVAVSAAGDGADDSIAAACAIAVSEGTTVEAVEVPAAVCESADLTPEQDAAAAQCAEDFVGLYEHVSDRCTHLGSHALEQLYIYRFSSVLHIPVAHSMADSMLQWHLPCFEESSRELQQHGRLYLCCTAHKADDNCAVSTIAQPCRHPAILLWLRPRAPCCYGCVPLFITSAVVTYRGHAGLVNPCST